MSLPKRTDEPARPAIVVTVSPGAVSLWRVLQDCIAVCVLCGMGLGATAFVAGSIYALLMVVTP